MKVGELFVELNVKGSDKTVNAFTSVKQSLNETASMAFATKAALLGVAYSIEQMASAAGSNAQNLINQNAALGINVQTLQKYEAVATRFGAAKGAVTGAFRSFSGMTAEYAMTGKVPARLSLAAGVIGDPGFLQAMERGDYPAVLQYLQKFAHSGINKNQVLATLNSLGAGGVADQVMRGSFNKKTLSEAPATSAATIKALDEMEQKFAIVGQKFAVMRDNFVAAWGPDLAKDMENLIPAIERLATSFMNLEKATLFMTGVAKAMEGLSSFFDGITLYSDAINGDGKALKTINDNMGAFFQVRPQFIPPDIVKANAAANNISVVTNVNFGKGPVDARDIAGVNNVLKVRNEHLLNEIKKVNVSNPAQKSGG